jgi:hypothetical protein
VDEMFRIGVIGQSGEIPKSMEIIAYDVGKEIALNKALLMTGATSGIMEYSSKGAKEAGGLSSKIKEFAYEGCYIYERKNIKLDFCKDAKTAVETVLRRCREYRNKKDTPSKVSSRSKKGQGDLI